MEELKKNVDSWLKSINNITEKYNAKQQKETELQRKERLQFKAKKQLEENKQKRHKPNQKDSIALAKNGYAENKLDNSEEEKKPGFEKNRLRHPEHKNYDKDKEAFLNQKSNNQSQNKTHKDISLSKITQENKRRVEERKEKEKNQNKSKERYR